MWVYRIVYKQAILILGAVKQFDILDYICSSNKNTRAKRSFGETRPIKFSVSVIGPGNLFMEYNLTLGGYFVISKSCFLVSAWTCVSFMGSMYMLFGGELIKMG
jgi:hypothetical protein